LSILKTLKTSVSLQVEGFGIPEWMHHAPIAQDWKVYNRDDNYGELQNQAYREAKRLRAML